MKAYLLSYNPVLGHEYVKRSLDSTHAVSTWVSPYLGCAILLSNLTVSELSAVVNTHFQGYWFIMTEATPYNSNGFLPGVFWNYISDPHTAWSKALLTDISSFGKGGLLDNPDKGS